MKESTSAITQGFEALVHPTWGGHLSMLSSLLPFLPLALVVILLILVWLYLWPRLKSRPPGIRDFLRRNWRVHFAIGYLVAVLIFASGLALQAWPDNPLHQRLYVAEAERLAVLQVTRESIDALNQAIVIASQLPAADESTRPSRAQLETLIAQVTLAQDLTRKPTGKLTDTSKRPDLNPLRWNRKTVGEVVERLLHARLQIEKRRPTALPTRKVESKLFFYWRIVAPAAMELPDPPLTNSEQARVAVLIADMNAPRPAGAAAPAIAQTARPLLDRMQDTDFILVILALGAWGAAATALSSIAEYLGNGLYNDRWFVFYLTRPIVGATLAWVFYVLLRGGLMTRDPTWTEINHLGYAAMAVLVGFFSTEAMENLKRIARGIFADKNKTDNLEAQKPVLSDLRWIEAPDADQLELIGDHFTPGACVMAHGQVLAKGVRFINSKKLVCDMPPETFAQGDLVQVVNLGADTTPSDSLAVPALPVNPVISKAELSTVLANPAVATADKPETKYKLTITGRRFDHPTVEFVDKNDQISLKMISNHPDDPTRIDLSLHADPIDATAKIRVRNRHGHGGLSDTVPLIRT